MEKLIGKITTYDKIVGYMKNPDADIHELTLHEQSLLNRWMEAFTMLRNYKSVADTAAILMKRFPELSRATAFRDCQNAIKLFGDIDEASKAGIRHLSGEIIRDALVMARALNDPGAMIKAALALAKLYGVNTQDPEAIDPRIGERHKYVFGLPPGVEEMFVKMAQGGRVDLTDVVAQMSKNATDAEIDGE